MVRTVSTKTWNIVSFMTALPLGSPILNAYNMATCSFQSCHCIPFCLQFFSATELFTRKLYGARLSLWSPRWRQLATDGGLLQGCDNSHSAVMKLDLKARHLLVRMLLTWRGDARGHHVRILRLRLEYHLLLDAVLRQHCRRRQRRGTTFKITQIHAQTWRPSRDSFELRLDPAADSKPSDSTLVNYQNWQFSKAQLFPSRPSLFRTFYGDQCNIRKQIFSQISIHASHSHKTARKKR